MTQTGVVAGGVLADSVSLGVLASSVPRDVVDDAIAEAGKGARRARGKLPPHVVVYLVMALALFADDDYEEVAARLTQNLRGWGGGDAGWEVPPRGGITQARQRLGPEPMAGVFAQVAEPVAALDTIGAFFGTWRLMSVDGMEWDVPDTEANRAAFGSRGGSEGPGAYPKIRVVTVSECASHSAVPAAMGPAAGGKGGGEQSLARELLPRLEEDWLLIADRNFYCFRDWCAAADTGAALLWGGEGARRYRSRAAVAGEVRHPAAGAGNAAGRVLPVRAGQSEDHLEQAEGAARGGRPRRSPGRGPGPVRPRGRVRDPGPRRGRQRRPRRTRWRRPTTSGGR